MGQEPRMGQGPGSGRVSRLGHVMEPGVKEESGRYRSLGGDMSQMHKSLRVGGTA